MLQRDPSDLHVLPANLEGLLQDLLQCLLLLGTVTCWVGAECVKRETGGGPDPCFTVCFDQFFMSPRPATVMLFANICIPVCILCERI